MFAASKTASVSGGYQISRSLRFNSADSAYLNRTPASAGNRRTWTFSAWVKRGSVNSNVTLFSGGVGGFGRLCVIIDSTGYLVSDLGGTGTFDQSSAVYRDPSAWYHFVWQFDTTQATAANRSRMYINGAEVTLTKTRTFTQNTDYEINNNVLQTIGTFSNSIGTYNFDGYQTEINFIDGQALTPSSFGETNAQTGVWQPKAYSGSYGTNGFYLNFSDNSNTTAATLGADYSGNGNNWTPNGFLVSAGVNNDSLVDSPTSYGTDTGVGGTVRGNYATLNPLQLDSVTTLTNGNLDYSRSILGGSPGGAFSTIGMTSGKWYAEFTLNTNNFLFGVWGNGNANLPQTGYPSFYWDFGAQTGALSLEKSSGSSSGSGGTTVAGNVYAIAVDIDNGTISFYQNNTLAYSVTGMSFTGPLFFVSSVWTNSVITGPNSLNFGQRPFAYTAPSGFKALCTQNLPTPTIGATTATQANKYFDTVLRTGAGGGTYSTTVNMANGALLWDKPRNQASSHFLFDSVRGISKTLSSNLTNAENTYTTWYTNFGSSSYTTGAGDWTSPTTLVDWIWAANGSGSTNTAGSITSTVSANTTSGFSIVTYTGTGANATVGHGLGVAPSMYIVKNRTGSADEWVIYHANLTSAAYYLTFTTGAQASNNVVFNSTAPTSTVFSVGTSRSTNTVNFVAYAFAPIAGYSAFGSFVGNGSADGPFIFTGMRPAFVMIKRINTTGDWLMTDATRNPYNAVSNDLYANTSGAEGSGFNFFDYLSNGFKARGTNASWNNSGDTYIYAAFAQNPFKTSLAR